MSMVRIATKAETNRVTRRERIDGITQHIYVKDEAGTVELWVDTDRLLRRYASKALASKGRKSMLAGGAIQFKAVDIREVKP